MKRSKQLVIKILKVASLLWLVSCASSPTNLKEAISKDPKIIFDVIEENPEQFIAVVNRAARKAQQKMHEQQSADQKIEQEKDLKDPKKPKLDPSRRLSGSDSSALVLVEYADFQCPACRMAYESIHKFKEKYQGQVQFYYKHMPLNNHPLAMPAALYFEAIRMQDVGKALKFYEILFQNQRSLSEDFFLKTAKQIGADTKRLAKDISSEAVKKIVEEDMAEFEKFEFTGTPSLILNGVGMGGAQSLEALEKVVEMTKKK